MTQTTSTERVALPFDAEKVAQVNAWVAKYSLVLRSLTEAEATRIAKLYHAAMAVDEAGAHAEDALRTFKALARESRNSR